MTLLDDNKRIIQEKNQKIVKLESINQCISEYFKTTGFQLLNVI